MLSDATAENEGKYLCKADNGVGEPVSKLAELTINGKTQNASSQEKCHQVLSQKAKLTFPFEET